MSSFKYFEKDGKTFLSIGDRLKIRWNKRWVPAAESVTVFPTSITLSKSSYTLAVDGSYTISATFVPENTSNKEVVWSSSDDTIATVSDAGKITGVAVGSATITCTSVADSNIKATCAITVQ